MFHPHCYIQTGQKQRHDKQLEGNAEMRIRGLKPQFVKKNRKCYLRDKNESGLKKSSNILLCNVLLYDSSCQLKTIQ